VNAWTSQIAVDQKDALTALRQRDREVGGNERFAFTAAGAGHHQYSRCSGHSRPDIGSHDPERLAKFRWNTIVQKQVAAFDGLFGKRWHTSKKRHRQAVSHVIGSLDAIVKKTDEEGQS
jgi:hypothetical protein